MAPELQPDLLIPFRWPAAWTEASLNLLVGGPVNCLLFDDPAHPAAAAARRAGFVVRDWNSLGAVPLAKLTGTGERPVVALSEVPWPRLKPMARGADADSGPTGVPWIDSCAWIARLAASRAPGKPIWLGFDPPPDLVLNAGSYRLALADCAATGARWMISLDGALSAGLASGNAGAAATWSQMRDTLAFFEKRAAWRAYRANGPLGVISSFSGDNEFMGTEFLNLAARRNLLYRVIDRSAAESADLAGLRAVLWIDPQPPSPAVTGKLNAFVQTGGCLIVPRSLGQAFRGEGAEDCPVPGYELRTHGKGTIAAARNDWDDPYFVVLDTHNLVSRRYDPVRLFNGSSLWVHYAVARAGGGSLIQFVNFASRAATTASLRIQYPHRSVQLHTLESGGPQPLRPVAVDGRNEYYLPAFSTYAALEVMA